MKYAVSEYPRTFPFLKHFQAIDPSFVTMTKPLNNNTGETYCERMNECVNFLRKTDKKICKNLSLSQNPLNILL